MRPATPPALLGLSGLILILARLALPLEVPALTAREIVRRADRIRAPGGSFSFELSIITPQGSEERPDARLAVSVKLPDRSLAKFLTPSRDRGKVLLMVGPHLWVYLPATGRPLRISPQQRLVGDVSHADVMRVNFEGDYLPTLRGVDRETGGGSYVLNLRGAMKGATYHRIRYWVERETFRPVKAEFLTVSGLLIKTARYTRYRQILGAARPTEIEIADAVRGGAVTRLLYSKLRHETLSDEMFHPASLRLLR